MLDKVFLANNFTGDSTTIWSNWKSAEARDKAVRLLLEDMGKVSVISVSKANLPHARSLCLDFMDGTQLQIWLDQGLGFLKVAYGNSEWQFPFYGTCEEQIRVLRTMGQTLEVVPGGTVISMRHKNN